jgi:hypothetical protein
MMTDVGVIQWLFDLERFATGMNWPVDGARLIQAKRALDSLVSRATPASEVLGAYQAFAAAVGPTVMSTLLQSDDAFPEVNHSGKLAPPSPGKVTLYVDPAGRRVLAECSNQWGIPPKLCAE